MKLFNIKITISKIIYFIIFIISSYDISSSLFIILNKNQNNISMKDYNSKWIYNSIKDRHVFIKTKEIYISNNKEIEIINYYNSYLYDENSIFLCLDVFDKKIEKSSLKSREIFFSSYYNCVDKKIDETPWNQINITSNYSLLKDTGLVLVETNNMFTIQSLPFQINSFFREDKNYNYLYVSYYIENNVIKHIIDNATLKEKNKKIYNVNYNFNGSHTTISLNNTFKMNSKNHIRNAGSLSSLVIDEIGNIVGFQAKQEQENDVIFVGAKYE